MMSDEMEESSPNISQRNKRRKVEKKSASAFEKLREIKQGGKRNKWGDEESSKIYDEVDEEEYTKIVSSRTSDWIVDDDGEGYVEDGREIFDDADDYETQPNSNKRKNLHKKRGKLPDEPVSKKKSLKNFFNNKVAKEKEATSVEDDNLLKNMLGELDSTNGNGSSSIGDIIAPKPMRSIRKQATEKEIEMKNYMDKFGKKAQEAKKKNDVPADDILDKLLKEERKSRVKDNKENEKSFTNSMVQDEPEELSSIELTLIPQEKTKQQQEEKELLEISLLEDIDEISNPKLNKVEVVSVKQTPAPASLSPAAPKTLSSKSGNIESTIFNELQGIDFDTEFLADDEGKIDWNEETMRFYYLDAWTDIHNRPGEVYLFGKVEVPGENNKMTFNSICVHIENVNRHLYLLPRTHVYDLNAKTSTDEEVTIAGVYQEFDEEISRKLKLFGSNVGFNSRKVSKSFAFTVPDVDVPIESDYLEVFYPGKFPAPNPKDNYSTIAHIFGSNTSPIETLLLERKIKGPCWLEIKNFKVIQPLSSWTKNQISCADIKCISVMAEQKAPPTLVTVTVNVKCILNPSNNRNEIVQISCLVNDKFNLDRPNHQLVTRQFCGITRPSNKNWPFDLQATLGKFNKFKIFKFDKEHALLSWFLSIYQNIDPDVVVTFDSNDCQLDIICNRLTALNVQRWSRIGRLNLTKIPGKRVQEFFIGRMICDVKLSATELIKSRTYDLGALCQKVLKIGEDERQEIIYDNIPFAYDSSASIIEFIELNVQDCIYISKLMLELNILPLALQITNIAGNLMSRTLQGGRSERNEFLLMHAFHEKQYIVPDRKLWKEGKEGENDETVGNQGKKKAAYTGGLVLDPIKGFYETFVLLMDFNSLYPSIIQEYNICYTTITPTNDPNELPTPPDTSVELGILPKQIRRLVESRRNVKALMKTPNLAPELKMQYDIRQMALKLTANSMYGCLGFSKSRFYAPHLAALVTCKGRDILMSTKTLVERLNHNVIYGDTDSIMINTKSQDFDEVYKIGANIKKAVNTIYKHVELDIDGVYQKLLLLKKKKYAAVAVTQKQGKTEYTYEFKGLDIVRRDWSKISSNTGKVVLDILLSNSGKEMDERIESIFETLSTLGNDLQEDKIPLPMLEITKQLTKAPSEYADMSSLPHVQVADRMNTQKNRRFKKGDMIDYIICEDGTDNPPPKRGYHIDEIKSSATSDKKLKVDKVYYLSHQVHPVICRLLEPIEGIDSAVIAEKLGLDPKDFRSKVKVGRADDAGGDHMIKTNEKKYKDFEKFMFPCLECKSINIFAAPIKRDASSKLVSAFQQCINADCKVKPLDYLPAVKNQLRASIVRAINRFYENWFVCDNPMCNNNTQNYAWPTDGSGNLLCLACLDGNLQRVYTNMELNMQLDYYNFMFDIRSVDSFEKLRLEPELINAYDMMLSTVQEYMEDANYFTIEFKSKFNEYDVQSKSTETRGKIAWKQFFNETYSE